MWGTKLNIILPLLFGLCQYSNALIRVDPLVETKVGLIKGLRASDGEYSMFLGIPYAVVNTSNPFGPSAPHPGYEGTFEAYDDSAICPQVEEFNSTVVGTLDCLHLNIYVPNSANSKNRLPVMVWIYGGGFTIGFAGRYLYGPRYLVRHDVILVTLNYRLGPYGFMCLDRPDVSGNQGLKDQRLALKWIKDNIDAFGGNPNRITLFGESAGGASVDFHLTYGKENLFNQVIMQSGTALTPWALLEPDYLAPLKLSEQLGYVTSDITEALSFLTNVDTNLLIAASATLGLTFRPCVEKEFVDSERFIHDYAVNIKKLNLRNIPILLGYNSDEWLVEYEISPEQFAKLNVFYDLLEMYFKFQDRVLSEMEEYVRHFYIGDEKISHNVKDGVVKFHSDFFINYGVVRSMPKYLENNAKNIYYYVFNYDGDRNFVKQKNNITSKGVAHADEISYFFDVSFMNEPTAADRLIIDRVTTLWTNFAKFGNPTPEQTELLPVKWPAVTKDVQYFLKIDSELKVEKRNFQSRMAFWDLFYKLNENAQLGRS